MPQQRVVDAVLRYLAAEGVRVVFGIPGGLLFPLFDALERDPEFQLVVTKHEQGAAFMADGYARSSGQLSVCAGTAGPGATNLLTGVACAFADGVPLLVFTGQAASHALGKGASQETAREDIDIVAMFRPVTKYSAMITTAESAAPHLRRALRCALSERPGPVHLNVPVDIWERPLSEQWFDPRTYRPSTRCSDSAAVEQASQLLASAQRPCILVGSGVGIARAQAQVIELAELLPARIATTPRAKGSIPEDHPLSLGVLGFAGHPEAQRTVLGSEVDVLLTVGASLNETTTFGWTPAFRPSRALIQLDIDPERIGRNYPVDVALVGDARETVTKLVERLRWTIASGRRPESGWATAEPLPRGHERYLAPALRCADTRPLTPQRWRVELDELLPADAIIFSDIGGHMLFNIHDLCVRAQQQFVLNLGFGSMGHGTAAPIGAALAHPGRTVVAIVGDACFTMNGMELLTAAEYGVPVIWLVENNNMHGITWHGSKLLDQDGCGLGSVVYRRPVRVADIARAMGLRAWTIDAPGQLSDAFSEAMGLRSPAVIEILVDAEVPPPLGGRIQSLAGFIQK